MTDQFSLPNTLYMISTMATMGFYSKPLLDVCSNKIKGKIFFWQDKNRLNQKDVTKLDNILPCFVRACRSVCSNVSVLALPTCYPSSVPPPHVFSLVENLNVIPFSGQYKLLQSCKQLLYRDLDLLTDMSDHAASMMDIWSNKQVLRQTTVFSPHFSEMLNIHSHNLHFTALSCL